MVLLVLCSVKSFRLFVIFLRVCISEYVLLNLFVFMNDCKLLFKLWYLFENLFSKVNNSVLLLLSWDILNLIFKIVVDWFMCVFLNCDVLSVF